MAALFALGVMSVPWMIVIAPLIAVEKLLPWRAAATAGVAAILAVLAVGVAVAPGSVPGLTIPSDHARDGDEEMATIAPPGEMSHDSSTGEMSHDRSTGGGSMGEQGMDAGHTP